MATWRTMDEAAKQLGISRRTLTRWVSQGLLTPYTIQGDPHTFIDMDEVKKLRQPRPRKPRGGHRAPGDR